MQAHALHPLQAVKSRGLEPVRRAAAAARQLGLYLRRPYPALLPSHVVQVALVAQLRVQTIQTAQAALVARRLLGRSFLLRGGLAHPQQRRETPYPVVLGQVVTSTLQLQVLRSTQMALRVFEVLQGRSHYLTEISYSQEHQPELVKHLQ